MSRRSRTQCASWGAAGPAGGAAAAMNPNACIVMRDGGPSIRQPTKPFKTGSFLPLLHTPPPATRPPRQTDVAKCVEACSCMNRDSRLFGFPLEMAISWSLDGSERCSLLAGDCRLGGVCGGSGDAWVVRLRRRHCGPIKKRTRPGPLDDHPYCMKFCNAAVGRRRFVCAEQEFSIKPALVSRSRCTAS